MAKATTTKCNSVDHLKAIISGKRRATDLAQEHIIPSMQNALESPINAILGHSLRKLNPKLSSNTSRVRQRRKTGRIAVCRI